MSKKTPTAFENIRLVGVHKEPTFGPLPSEPKCKPSYKQLQAELDAEKKAVKVLLMFLEDAKKQIKTWTDRWNNLREENRWIPVEDGPPKSVVWRQIVEAIKDCAEVPMFVSLEQIFMDEGSEFTHWRPIDLPESDKEQALKDNS